MTLDLPKLQKEVHEWSVYNFGDQPAENPLIGLIEETGELAHAYLKTKQKIRGIGPGDLEDAVGDIFIYLMDYTARVGFKIPDENKAEKFYGEAIYTVSLLHIAMVVGDIAHSAIYARKPSYWRVGLLLTYLNTFCIQNNLTFEEAVTRTWDEVKQRDWRKFPKNGRNE